MTPLAVTFWVLNVILDTTGQLAFKAAARTEGTGLNRWRAIALRPWMWIGLACYVGEFVAWLAFLSFVPLSQGVLLGSVNILTIMIAGRLLFGEVLSNLRLLGIALVALGVAIVGLG
ncbi:MAG: hypothetical protein JWR00_1162 [Rubritepida sp.]|nr:hypothetical protein [Rubritepida sp.]